MKKKRQKQTPGTFLFTRTFILIFVFMFFTTNFHNPFPVSANSLQKNHTDAFDAVFVLDTSYSMNHADPNKMANEVIHMFMDMSEASRTNRLCSLQSSNCGFQTADLHFGSGEQDRAQTKNSRTPQKRIYRFRIRTKHRRELDFIQVV